MNETPWLFLLAVVPLAIGAVLAAIDVATRADLSWPRRLLWWIALLVAPPIALGLYAIVRPPRHRAVVASEALGTERAAAIVDLVERHSRGDIDDDAYVELIATVGPNS